MGELKVVCCDVDRAYIRLAWASDDLDSKELKPLPPPALGAKADAVVAAIRAFVIRAGARLEDVGVCISVPTRAVEDTLRVREVEWMASNGAVWESSISHIESELNAQAFALANDMVVLSYAIPELNPSVAKSTRYLRVLGGDASLDGYPIVVVGVRRYVGVAGLVRAPDRWLPIQTEGGGIGLHTSNDHEHDILHMLRTRMHPLRRASLTDPYTLTANDALSELGLSELVETVALHEWERRGGRRSEVRTPMVPFDNPQALLELATRDGEHRAVADKAIRLWGAYMGAHLRDLALAYGALGGIYLEGDLPIRFLTHNPCGALDAMNKNFEYGGPDDRYLKAIPRILITHPNPYLKGLARIQPRARKST